MDENEILALKTLRTYLSCEKILILDDDARKILETDIKEHSYYLYEPEELKTILKNNGVNIETLPKEFLKLMLLDRAGNFISWKNGDYLIAIRKKVPDQFVICTFIHEYGHFQFSMGSWISKRPPNTHAEEFQCDFLSKKYALKNGFLKKYRAEMNFIFHIKK